MNDSGVLDDTEQYVSKSHTKLLEAISQLDKGPSVKKAERSEPTSEVSEFHLVKSGISDKDAVHIHDLTNALGKKGYHLDITKNVKSATSKVQVLDKPLEKHAADRIKRIVGFENTKFALRKWNAIITKNRIEKSLQFPLNQSSMRLEPKFVKRFRLQSELEKELAAFNPQKENIEKEEDEFILTMKEITMKRNEAARIRAQQSYREAKARRQGKIKSKKFHRVEKKARTKLQLKEFEELQKVNPQGALEKLELLDKIRAEERMSLRHKSTGKWAQSKLIRAKYDKETQQELAQQLSVGRELTQKLKQVSDSEEEGEDDNVPKLPLTNDKDNPWVGNTKNESEIDEFISSYRSYWDEQNNQLKDQKLNVNGESKTEIRQVKASENLKPPPVSKEENVVHNLKSSELQNDDKIIEISKSNENGEISIENINPLSNSEDPDTTCSTEVFEIQSPQNDTTVANSNKENVTRRLRDKTVKRKALNNDKRLNKKVKPQAKDTASVSATSNWNVESVANNDTRNVSNSLKSDYSNADKINEIFDSMAEKKQDRVKPKPRKVKRKNTKIPKSGTKKSRKEDNFDGLELRAEKQKPILDSPLDETTNKESTSNVELKSVSRRKNNNILSEYTSNKFNVDIDPTKYINVKPKHLNTDLPAVITGGDDALDDSEDEKEKYNVISEAFADDDVVEEFRNEKREVIKKSQPKDIDLTLPGWGSWGGKNKKVPKHKKKRFILKFPKEERRKDENKGNVIIFEEANAKIKDHQVRDLPHPFTSVSDYEASIRMPIGRNFIPEKAHRKLITPAIKTNMGEIIEPMTHDVLVKTKESSRKNPPKNLPPKKRDIKTTKNIKNIKNINNITNIKNVRNIKNIKQRRSIKKK